MLFQDLGTRKVVADFGAGHLSNDGGALLLDRVNNSLGLSSRVAGCFGDSRDQRWVEHPLERMIKQRIFGLALGYEDLNDHQEVRRDPLIAASVGNEDLLGEKRRQPEDQGNPLAAPCTLNRLELGHLQHTRAHKIVLYPDKMQQTVLDAGVRCLDKHSRELILDFDATDDPLHGNQEGRFFHGYYKEYCYLPLYCFIGDVPVWSQLQCADGDASAGTEAALEKIVAAVRKRCPNARIILRGDSGFCREAIMKWCEENGVKYVLGLARNARLAQKLEGAMISARQRQCLTGTAVRVFADFEYRTQKTWSRARRVIGKAEVTLQGDNPRYIVTNLQESEDERRFEKNALYEKLYCGRGQMENVIKQQQLDLHADRTSTRDFQSNQLRLWFSTLAYLLVERIRTWGLAGTRFAKAQAGTIIGKLLKVAAHVQVSVRRVHIQMASSYPWQDEWAQCHHRLAALEPLEPDR